MKKRLYFNKYGEMKFISHLDLLRFLERILLKGDIPVKYSQGFHPRPKISLGNPISLGTEAFNEVMEIDLEKELSNEILLEKMKKIQVKGFEVISVEDSKEKESIVERFKTGIYKILGTKENIDKIEALFNQENIIEVKEKKGKEVTRDLKEKVKGVSRENNEEIIVYLENGSPNTFIELSGVSITEIEIKKYGYYHN